MTPLDGSTLAATFRDLFILLSLHSFRPVWAGQRTVASAHERINQGQVLRIRHAQDSMGTLLAFDIMSGMSRSKQHPVFVRVEDDRLTFPTCNCVNGYVLRFFMTSF